MKHTLLLALLLFCVAGLAILIMIRQRQLNTPTAINLPPVRQVLVSPLPSNKPLASAGDTYSLSRLVRGRVLEYQAKTQTLTLVRDSLTPSGQSQSEIVALNLHNMKEITCWPETMQTIEGRPMSITRAFFPLDETSKLYLAGEQNADLISVLGYLAQSQPYIFALLTDPQNSSEPHEISQLVVVNCP